MMPLLLSLSSLVNGISFTLPIVAPFSGKRTFFCERLKDNENSSICLCSVFTPKKLQNLSQLVLSSVTLFLRVLFLRIEVAVCGRYFLAALVTARS